MAQQAQEALLRIDEVSRRVGFGKTAIYALIKKGRFPPQRRLSHRIAVWRERDISEWIAGQSE